MAEGGRASSRSQHETDHTGSLRRRLSVLQVPPQGSSRSRMLTQLRLSERTLGLLINFGEVHLKNGLKRIVNGLAEEPVEL